MGIALDGINCLFLKNELVAALKMLPTDAQAACLTATLERCNTACDWLAETAWNAGTFGQYALHKISYTETRSRFGLTAQAAVRCISKVADAYKLDRDTQRSFRWDAAQPYDDRIIRFVKDGSAVSLWTLEGRMIVPIVMGEHQKRLMAYRKGEVDLCLVRGKWILAATCDIPETDEFEAEDWLGVDLGIVSLATDSDGKIHSGAEVERKRQHIRKRRRGLQKCGTRGAKRRLRKLAATQRRYQKHTNHVISKALVLEAERTSRGIGLEQLKGIRQRVTARGGNQRARLTNWGFGQLGAFVAYKAKRAGVPVVFVDPRNTSRECSECGCVDKKNRRDQSTFKCIGCGREANADLNAARNIRQRAIHARANVMTPEVLAA
jgi:IS605 OrfB family transposase